MQVFPEFPNNRRRDPRYQAEFRAYETLQASDADGIALYGARLNRQCRELDYPILLTDGARFGVEVKGNSYRLDGTEWQLQTTEGWERQPNPLTQVWDASMQMRDGLGDRLEHKPFIIPIIHFPDMEPDRDIEGRAMRAGVHAIFGLGDFVERLIEIGQEAQVFYPPTRREIESEAEIVMPGVKAALQEQEVPELRAQQVIIHAQVVNIHPGLDGQPS